jgi:hypothetical protein
MSILTVTLQLNIVNITKNWELKNIAVINKLITIKLCIQCFQAGSLLFAICSSACPLDSTSVSAVTNFVT